MHIQYGLQARAPRLGVQRAAARAADPVMAALRRPGKRMRRG